MNIVPHIRRDGKWFTPFSQEIGLPLEQLFLGSGASTLLPPSSSGSGILIFIGSGSPVVPAATSAGSGSQVYVGAGASSLAPPTSNAIGAQIPGVLINPTREVQAIVEREVVVVGTAPVARAVTATAAVATAVVAVIEDDDG